MKIAASILALIAFVAIFMTVLIEAQRFRGYYDESVGRQSYTQGNGRTYRSNGYTMNSRGYLANPTRSAQINARNAGALTNSEARSMGLRNYRDEIANDESVGWRGAAIKYGPQAINAVRTWGPVIKHCVSSMCGGDEMAGFDEEESVGWDDQPSHTRAQRPTGQSVSNYYNNWRL